MLTRKSVWEDKMKEKVVSAQSVLKYSLLLIFLYLSSVGYESSVLFPVCYIIPMYFCKSDFTIVV